MPTSVSGRVSPGSGSAILRLAPASASRGRVALSSSHLRLVGRSGKQLILHELREVRLERQVRVLSRLALEELHARSRNGQPESPKNERNV